jgi:hypothetical protein
MISRVGLLCVGVLCCMLTTAAAHAQPAAEPATEPTEPTTEPTTGPTTGPTIGQTTGQTDRLATATSLFEAAQRMVQEGDAAKACTIFEESYRLQPANGTLINLADCYEREGKTASAWLSFRQVVQRADQGGQDARADVARKRVAQLQPRLSRLRILVGNNAALDRLTVKRDAVVLKPAALGVPVIVDPGSHRITAKAPGHRDWEQLVQVRGEGKTVDVTLPAMRPLRAAPPEPAPDDGLGLQSKIGIAALVIGGAGVVAGVALGGAAKAKADDADCDEADFCSPDGLAQRDDAVVLGNIGTGVAIAGAAFAVLGLTLWLTASDDGTDSGALLGLRVSPGGVTFGGSF